MADKNSELQELNKKLQKQHDEDTQILQELYKLQWMTTHRSNIGSGIKGQWNKFVSSVLQPRLTVEVTDKLDRELIDGK